MSFIDLKGIIFDTATLISIIAINMTVIGLTSLAETKKNNRGRLRKVSCKEI